MIAPASLNKQSEVSMDNTVQFQKIISNSKRVRWDIDNDVIRGRQFDVEKKFLPDSLSMVYKMRFLSPKEMKLLNQIQGRGIGTNKIPWLSGVWWS